MNIMNLRALRQFQDRLVAAFGAAPRAPKPKKPRKLPRLSRLYAPSKRGRRKGT